MAQCVDMIPIPPENLATGRSPFYVRSLETRRPVPVTPIFLFDFSSSRTHGGGLPGLGVNADQRHSADSAAADGNYVTASPQVGLHRFGEALWYGEAAQAGTVLTEG